MPGSEPTILRVFPRRTKATPSDPFAVVGGPGLWDPQFIAEYAPVEVHVSVAFTWDIPRAHAIARAWSKLAPTKVGGPAFGDAGGEFHPGKYLARGYTITSRGCPNRCKFCFVPRREGRLRELPIRDGWNVLDNNLLACSEPHVYEVFAMLRRQPHRVAFTGGLEARRMAGWIINLLAELRPRPEVFFAYDPGDDLKPVRDAAEELFFAGFTRASHRVRCYVLIGYPGDTIAAAEGRLADVLKVGLTPMAMLWRGEAGDRPGRDWRRFQRRWARPAIIHATKVGA
jgi:hypothetical protein